MHVENGVSLRKYKKDSFTDFIVGFILIEAAAYM